MKEYLETEMRKLSICFVSFNYYDAQGATEFIEYSHQISKMGHIVYVIAAGRKNEKSCEILNGIKIIRIPVKNINKRSIENIKFSFLASNVILNMIKNNNIEIIHIISYAFSSLIKVRLLQISKKVKWVYDIRSGPIENRITPSIFYILGIKILQFESLLFDSIFINGEAVKNKILGNWLKNKVSIITVGVDLKKFQSNIDQKRNQTKIYKYGIREKKIKIVYLGSIAPQRRLQNVILAFYKASLKIENIILIIIGSGIDLSNLKRLTKKYSLSDKIIFTGHIKFTYIPQLLSKMDIAISYIPIVPAFDAQPPVKTLEYLACSLPVIATSTKGNQIFIKHLDNGLLVKDTPESISKAIIWLYNDLDLRTKLAQNARPSVEKYNWRNIVEKQILPAYQQLLRD
jgi:glycosyltransferase involved in cell wall biosynthesis